jgi:hypothetical protein
LKSLMQRSKNFVATIPNSTGSVPVCDETHTAETGTAGTLGGHEAALH